MINRIIAVNKCYALSPDQIQRGIPRNRLSGMINMPDNHPLISCRIPIADQT